jgi:hypothetical protein
MMIDVRILNALGSFVIFHRRHHRDQRAVVGLTISVRRQLNAIHHWDCPRKHGPG